MALSDNPLRASQKSTKNRKIYAKEKTWWSDNQKLEAVQTYLTLGNVAMTARVLKIPDDTLRRWRRQQWWIEIESDLKIQDNLMLSARLKKIVERSFDAVEDRLEHGDWVYDQKTGALRRKHVNMRDAHKVAIDLMDKRDKLLGNAVPQASEEQIDDKLNKLATTFAEMVNKKIKPPVTVVDVEVREAPQGGDSSFQDDGEEFDSPAPLQDEST